VGFTDHRPDESINLSCFVCKGKLFFEQCRDHIHGYRAGYLAPLMPAHAIGDDEQAKSFVDLETVFIMIPNPSHIRLCRDSHVVFPSAWLSGIAPTSEGKIDARRKTPQVRSAFQAV
jgi:hypothetical protein